MFNWVDDAIIGIILLSVLISVVRGFVREALSLITWVIAIWAGIHYSAEAGKWLAPYISSTTIRMAAAFFLLFFLTLLAGSLISFVLVKFIHKTGLSGTDRSLGILFGIARGFVVVSVGLLMLSMMFPPGSNPEEANVLKQSQLAPHFKPVMDWLRGFLPESASPELLMNLPKISE